MFENIFDDETFYDKEYSNDKFPLVPYYLSFRNCNFVNIDFSNSNLEKIDFKTCKFKNCDFRNANFSSNGIKEVTFTNCNLLGIDFSGSMLMDSIFCDSNLDYSNFSLTKIKNVKFNNFLLKDLVLMK